MLGLKSVDTPAQWQWTVKLFKRDAQIETVPGSGDMINVKQNSLKASVDLDWTPRSYSNRLQICAQASWVISASDIDSSSNNINARNIKSSNGNVIGFQVFGGFDFSCVWPGPMKHSYSPSSIINAAGNGTGTGTDTYNSFEVVLGSPKYQLSGTVQMLIESDRISNHMTADPVISVQDGSPASILSTSASSLLLSVLLAILLAFFTM